MGVSRGRWAVAAFGIWSCAAVSAVAPGLAVAHPTVALPPGTHGPDPAGLERLVEAPGPRGGPSGRQLREAGPVTAPLVTASLPEQWCGDGRREDDVGDETSNGVYKYHAVYAHPSDGTNRLATLGSAIQTDALQASALLERTYGVAIRFDMGTICGPQFLDISSIRLSASTSQLAAAASSATGVFPLLVQEMTAAGQPVIQPGEPAATAAARTKNIVVWYDGPAAAGVCGQGMLYDDPSRRPDNWNNYAGKVAVVFRSATGSGFCNSNTVRHEIGHTLGALQPGASHATADGHCTDAYEDTMCVPSAPPRQDGSYHALFFDYGRDDYWDPAGGSLPHWTVNLSRFVCPDIACNVPGGSGSGGLLDSDGDLIPDVLDPCPRAPGATCPAGEPGADASRRQPTGVRMAVSARRSRRGWRLRIRLTGGPRARLSVMCGRHHVYRRAVAIPRTVRMTRRCGARPRVVARWLRS